MGAKHTPGPWVDLDNGFGTARAIHAEKSGPALAFVHSYSGLIAPRAEERDANARLIAAAPDLLDELKRLRKAYVSLLQSGRDRIIDFGGTCDAVDVMEAGDPALRSAAATIAKAGS